MNVHAGFGQDTSAISSIGLELRGVSKSFGSVSALTSVSLSVRPSELLAITGPSGAGKTTLCRIVAGLERPDTGVCFLSGHDLAAMSPGARRVAYMFESYALYPHMTVRENVLSPLAAPNGRGVASTSADELLELLEIRHLAERLPAALSGGQKQRVALARTLVQEPAVTLLDEPISHLDAKLRYRLRNDIRRMVSSRPSPTVWCTPDAMEALSVADRVALIESGSIAQIGTPDELWLRPASVRVARLVGDPPMNLLTGHIEIQRQTTKFVSANLHMRLSTRLAKTAIRLGNGAPVILGVRPHLLTVASAGAPLSVAAELYAHEAIGKYAIVTMRLGESLVKAKTGDVRTARIGEVVGLILPEKGFVLFDLASGIAIASDGDAGDEPVADREAQIAPARFSGGM